MLKNANHILLVFVMLLCVNACQESTPPTPVKETTDKDGNTVFTGEVRTNESVSKFPAKSASRKLTQVKRLGRFAPGQIWSYETRTGEESSRVTILRLETSENLGGLIHVRIDGISIPNPKAVSGVTNIAEHMPFSQEAIEKSVLKLEATLDEIPQYKAGYDMWLEAFKNAKAGIFTTSVGDSVSILQKILNPEGPNPCKSVLSQR